MFVYCKVYNEVKEVPFADTEGDSDTALTGEKNIHFDDLRKWILKAIKGIENQALNCSQESIGENLILVQVLSCIHTFFVCQTMYIRTYVRTYIASYTQTYAVIICYSSLIRIRQPFCCYITITIYGDHYVIDDILCTCILLAFSTDQTLMANNN